MKIVKSPTKIDMSPQAIKKRLMLVAELHRLYTKIKIAEKHCADNPQKKS